MKKIISTLFLLLFLGFAADAQTYTMSTSTVTTCSGTFYDSGGAAGNYSNNENSTMTFTSGNGNRLSFNFSTMSMSLGDYMIIYDGPTTSHPIIGTYDTNPGVINSTGTSLTFFFFSTSSSTSTGWAATISCTTAPLTIYNLTSGTVTACSGAFYDNAGAAANYTDNLNITQTFCSGTTDRLQFSFLQSLQSSNLALGDTLFIYDGATTSAPLLSVHVNGSNFETFTTSGTCATFRFKSNASGNSIGWAGQFQCTSTPPAQGSFNMSAGVRYVCNAMFYDNGGAANNYSNNLNLTQTFTSYNGERISANFGSMNMSLGDYIIVYDGPTTAYPVIGVYDASPGIITSTGTSLTFFCYSTSSSTSTGWDAAITCAGPILPVYNMSSGTVTACSGVFYDNGGPAANYTNNQNVTQTFCSGTTDHIQFSFRPSLQATNLDLGDTLFIYDGATASAPPLAILVDGSIFETFTSSGTCLTFRFKSNASGNSLGWAGQFQCVPTIPTPVIFNMSAGVRYVCNAVFYDNGGANNNYSNNLNLTQTFTSYNGERISANFGSMNMSLGDYIIVYDGPTTAYPVIGVYDASPGIITSTGTSLTFFCYSTSSSTSTGWDAAITCAGPILQVYNMSSGTVTACNGVFYDNGGAIGNYPNNENRVMTFTSSTGQYLKFDFNPNHFNMATGDSLFIYDGTSTSAPLYAVFTGSVSPGSITSNTSSFTFRFKSDAATNNVGWQAVFSCVAAPDLNPQISMMSGIRYTCGGNFYDIGGASANYWNNENRTMSFYSNSGCGIRFTFTSFSLSGGDILYVYDGPSITSPLIATLTGSTLPAALQSSGNVLTFRFTSTSSSNSIGWAATISCPNQPLATITANGPLNFCPGDSVILTAAPNATYLWNTGATTQSITVNTAGSYSVNVVNANSCSATSNIVTVTTNASITASATASGSTTFCQGGSVTLNASGGTSYVWSNNSTGSSLQATQSGSYYVIASSGTCVDTSSVINVTVNPLPAVTLTLPQDSFCTNQSPSGLSGGSPTGGSWSGSGVSGNLFNPATAGPGIHIISYTYTDSLGCANIATQTVEVDVCTDITEIQPQHIGIYPNPAQDFVIITISNSSDIKTINVYDLSGRILISEAVNNRNQVQLSLSGISTGVYVISAGNHSVKLVKE